ncbi:MAG TPA: methyltransferase [Micromonosporaceae bacterium]|nr:methyltransferase [Micromonosporaceae bacterium]
MRLSLRGDSILERALLGLGLVPRPALEAWAGLALSSTLISAAELGVFARLARTPMTSAALAEDLGLNAEVADMLLQCLHSTGYLTRRRGAYALARRTRRWLDPASPHAVTSFVAACADYQSWWSRLSEVAAGGAIAEHHASPADSGYWRRYLSGQRDLARLAAGEVARRVPIPDTATRMLDIGGGHGWYSAAICGARPSLESTIVDLPGSVRIGAELVTATGLAERVHFVEGNALSVPLGEGYDAILCFNVIHHLRESDVRALFTRARAAIKPGGVLCVMDAFDDRVANPRPAQAYGSLFMYLSSGSQIYPHDTVQAMLAEVGFDAVRRSRIRRLPETWLYAAMVTP